MQVAFFELARLRHGLAVERAEDHPERVDRGHERAHVPRHVQRPVPGPALAGDEQDLVLREEPRERRHAGKREAADHEAAVGERHRSSEAAHPVERLLARHRADERPCAHEQERLEEGVRHHVEHARGVGADGHAHDHVADLRHRRVGDHPLDVGLHERHRRRHQQRRAADHGPHVLRGGRAFEQRMHARDQIDTGGHHRRRVDQRAHRGGAFHRIREPRLQRDLRGLGERPDEQQDASRHEVRLIATRPERAGFGCGERLEEVERARVLEDEVGTQHEPHVAHHVDDERLEARARRRRALVPEGDQQVGGGAHERPAHDQDQEVAGEDQQQHREHEEVQVREEAHLAAVRVHVGDRVEVDRRGHPGDEQDHEHRQRVHEDRHFAVDPDGRPVLPQRRDELAVVGRVALQGDERRQRRDERQRDRDRPDPSGRAPRDAAEAERLCEAPDEREQHHEPCPGGRAHARAAISPAAPAARRRRSAACGGRSPRSSPGRCTPRRRRRSSPRGRGSARRRCPTSARRRSARGCRR